MLSTDELTNLTFDLKIRWDNFQLNTKVQMSTKF